MIGVYFSGTGNTKYCVEQFLKFYDKSDKIFSIENNNILNEIQKHSDIVFGYPVYFSNIPKIVRDFLTENKKIFQNKNIFIIATMALFSGDGAGCSARLFNLYGANVIGAIHIIMPDCIADERVLKYSFEKNKQIIEKANKKIKITVKRIKSKNPPKEGLNILYQMSGLLCQRLWFYNKTKNYTDKIKINSEKCIACGKCVDLCPMNNLNIIGDKISAKSNCTMCYRCINICPKKAIVLFGKKVISQHDITNYIEN